MMTNPFDKFDEPAATAANPFDQFDQAHPAPSMRGAVDARATVPSRPASVLQRAQALGAGANRGIFTDLIGIPVDTVANLMDLGRAGVGTVATMVGRPDLAPDIPDRSTIVGSSDWIARKLGEGAHLVGAQNPVAPARPDDAMSRTLFAMGRGAGMSFVPSAELSGAAQLANMVKGGASGLASGTVAESHPEWAGVAGMLPQLAGNASAATVKYAVRGREAGRQAMAQRVADLQAGGIDSPSVGLASGNKIVSGLENLLSQTPGSMGLYDRAQAANVAGMQAKTYAIRNAISPEYGAMVAGSAIQSDLTGPFKNRIGNTYSTLNDRVEQVVGAKNHVPVDQTILRSGQLSTPVPGAEATSSNFIQPRISKINRDLLADSGGKPAQVVKSTILGPDGLPAMQSVIPATSPQGIPFSALKDLRTKIGKEAASNAIMGTPEQGEFKQLYGAMSQDMQNGVAMADLRNGIAPASASSATTALNRANTFYSRAMNRADDLKGIANRATPEGAYDAVASSLKAGPTIWEKLRGAITPEARQKVVATVVNDMGAAAPGQQNVDGTTWSARSFLTNYNRLDPDARNALFTRLPGGQRYADNLSKVAKAAEMMGDSSKVWANPSGTSHALAARGSVGALGLGVVGGLFYHPLLVPAAVAGGSMIGANATSRLLLNQQFVHWLAKAPVAPSAAQTQAYAQRLLANAKLSGDKQFQQDAADYINALRDAGQ